MLLSLQPVLPHTYYVGLYNITRTPASLTGWFIRHCDGTVIIVMAMSFLFLEVDGLTDGI